MPSIVRTYCTIVPTFLFWSREFIYQKYRVTEYDDGSTFNELVCSNVGPQGAPGGQEVPCDPPCGV